MTITFLLITAAEQRLTEADLPAVLERAPSKLADSPELFGELHFQHDGTEALQVVDEMSPLIAGLCVHAPAELRAGRDVYRHCWAQTDGIGFTLEGGTVVVTREADPEPRIYPRDELIAALEDCGRRYHSLLKQLHGNDPAWRERIAVLEQPGESET